MISLSFQILRLDEESSSKTIEVISFADSNTSWFESSFFDKILVEEKRFTSLWREELISSEDGSSYSPFVRITVCRKGFKIRIKKIRFLILFFTFSIVKVMKFAILIIGDLGSESIVTIDQEISVYKEFPFFSSLHGIFVESHTSSRLELEFDFISCRMGKSFLKNFVGFFEVFISFTKSLETKYIRKSVFLAFFKVRFKLDFEIFGKFFPFSESDLKVIPEVFSNH